MPWDLPHGSGCCLVGGGNSSDFALAPTSSVAMQAGCDDGDRLGSGRDSNGGRQLGGSGSGRLGHGGGDRLGGGTIGCGSGSQLGCNGRNRLRCACASTANSAKQACGLAVCREISMMGSAYTVDVVRCLRESNPAGLMLNFLNHI